MGFFSQLGLMLWKNWLIQKRKVCVTVFELLLPVFFATLLLLLRLVIDNKQIDNPTTYAIEELTLEKYYFNDVNNTIIGYTPQGAETDKVMTYVEGMFKNYTPGVNVSIHGFADEDAMEDFFESNSDYMRHCITFKDTQASSSSLNKNLEFAVRPFTGDERWRTRRTYEPVQRNEPRDDQNMYKEKGVLYMQRLVGESLIKYWLDKTGGDPSSVNLGPFSQRMAFPPYVEDPMIIVIQGNLPLFLVLSFILSVIVNTKNLVYEKERKLKESMKLMGLKASVHWLSWFITFCVYLIPSLLLYSLFIGVDIIPDKGAILSKTETSLLFVFLIIYGWALITFCFMVASFVQKANVGAALAGILFFAMYCPYFYLQNNYDDLSKSTKLGTSLVFNCAMGLGANLIGLYEGTGEGLQWKNFADPATVDDNLSMLECMIMLIVDGFIHLIIFWYLENVRPGEFGVPKPFYFCFTRSYWCGAGKDATDHASYHEANGDSANVRFEKEPTNLNAGIQIKELRKVYGKKPAVEGLSLNMYDGQITVMLGHNGAGKTTTMSMLTGFIPPTSGSAIVNDYDITENIDGVRSSLGLCPQHNILFDTLTVKEHLEFFARLKGASNKDARAEITPLVQEVGLGPKMDDYSANLSGGQKRKLSVAIALIAGSKIVILDEPSSGMDPAARRQTWNVLQNHRQGRTMVLTTHYMDEADVLGDRIAIMAEGVIKCCGSSMFLKKLYGAGYHLVVVKDSSCDVDKVTEVVTSHIESAKLENIINQEVTYLLPDKETAKFPPLFVDLENRKQQLGISSFGTSATTMEEVFLKVGDSAAHHDEISLGVGDENGKNGFSNPAYDSDKARLADDNNHFGKNKVHSEAGNNELVDKATDIMSFNKGYTKRTGLNWEMGKMYALFVKKALHTWRNRTISLVQLLLPVLFTIAGLALDELRPSTLVDPPMNFDLGRFDRTEIPTTAGLTPTAGDTRLETTYGDQFGTAQTIKSFNLATEDTYDNYTLKRADELGIGTFNKRVIVGLEVTDKSTYDIKAISHWNGQPYHAQPIGVNYMMNAFLQWYMNSSYSMESSIDPLPVDVKTAAENNILLASSGGFTVALFVSFGMAFLTTLFIHYLIKERQVGSKHLQIVSGVGPISFWIPNFLWDFVNYIVPSLLLLVVFAAYNKTAFIGDTRSLLVILILVMYGWAMLPFMYALQFLFREPPTGVVTVIMLNIFSGLICLLAIFILGIPGLGTEDVAEILDYIFMVLFPNYGMAQAFVNMYSNYYGNKDCEAITCFSGFKHPCCKATCDSVCYKYESNYLAFDRPGVGAYIIFLAIQGVVYFAIVMLVEYNVFQRCWYLISSSKGPDVENFERNVSTAEDSDVAAERQRINSNPASVLAQSDSLLLVNLFKQYGQFVAVDQICVGIPDEECFGLLGQNGAGKTTTFKMLTGDVMVTGGNAYLTGYDVRNDIKNVQANMGYCPQFDALIDQMTGRETLTMYARLRGVPEENIKNVVNHLIDILMLRPHADKMSGAYSGGNKRKLSTAIALVGDPKFIMLDEPSAGMDPKARRQLWNVLSQVRASGRTLILTSHSMEECDALCTRIAIMVNGHFVCLGSPQHLKNKFGQGYTLIVQLGSLDDGTTAPIEPVTTFVMQNFPGAKVFDDHQGYIHFQVPDSTIKLADVFSLMESTKSRLNVRDYSVHQTTLEQVFLTFTRSQNTSTEAPKKNILGKICFCARCFRFC